MKKTDFDSIKEKFDNSGVNAPDALHEDRIAGMLPEQPLQALPPKQSRKKVVAGVSAAAAFAVVTAGAITFTSLFHQPFSPKFVAGTASLRAFGSRDELTEEVKKIQNIRKRNSTDPRDWIYGNALPEKSAEYNHFDAALPDTGSSSGSSSHNSTYVQATGVDEADCVKTTATHIFYLNGNTIHIFSAEGKNAKEVGTVEGTDNNELCDFYVSGDRLITLGVAYRDSGVYTEAVVYDISDVSAVKKSGGFSQSGDYLSSRMIGDTLYMVSNHYARYELDLPQTGAAVSTADSATMDEIPYTDVFSVETPSDTSFLVVSRVDVKTDAQVTKSKAILGSGNIIYCNQENLYVTAYEFAPEVYNNLFKSVAGNYWDIYGGETATQIIKISLTEGIDFVASEKVDGMVNNQYALDEYNGKLRVATTSRDSEQNEINNLYVLDENLRQLGSVTGFAQNESIKAVRYINDTAYVITYEQTDPLFVIDVSDPSQPAIKGEVKISGFSTLLVPVDDNTLLGIGYHTTDITEGDAAMEMQDGVKIVTFDVSDKSDPKVLDTQIFENYYSAVQHDPKALLVNFERGDFTIPMSKQEWTLDGWKNTSEALNFRIENGKIKIIDRYVSEKFSDQDSNLQRCVHVGDNIYLLGTHYKEEYRYEDSVYNGYVEYRADIDSTPYK